MILSHLHCPWQSKRLPARLTARRKQNCSGPGSNREGKEDQMRAFAHDSFGEAGSTREIDLPHPSANEVRVKVVGASVNPIDWKTGKGYLKAYVEHRFPLISGQDVSGVVDAVGAHVHDLKEGDEVFGFHGQAFM